MNTKSILFFIFILLAIERIIWVFRYERNERGKIKYLWTSFLLITSYIICIFLSVTTFLIWSKTPNLIITSIGFLILCVGIILRRAAIMALNENWSIHIKDIPSQQLIQGGPYKYMRHPYYLAVVLELIGIAVYFNSFLIFVFIFFFHVPLLLLRIRLEEKTLIAKFQDQYISYRKNTAMFLPLRIK